MLDAGPSIDSTIDTTLIFSPLACVSISAAR
jgi:hypothetical protein